MVHFRRVPAGRTVSRALALKVKVKVNVRRDAARTAKQLDFILHLGLTPWNFRAVPNNCVEPAPIYEVIHKLTGAVNRPLVDGGVAFLQQGALFVNLTELIWAEIN
jgi:hypothetical protein